MSPETEEELIARCTHGREEARKELVKLRAVIAVAVDLFKGEDADRTECIAMFTAEIENLDRILKKSSRLCCIASAR